MKTCTAHDIIAAQRFWSKVEKTDDCWNWTGARSNGGYGNFWDHPNKRTVRAHRWSYEHSVGPIPAGLDLDHLCRNRACVNPAHLEPVSRRENSMRGLSPTVVLHHLNECSKGHELTPANTYFDTSGRGRCRICVLAKNRRYKQRRKARAAA